MAEKVKKEKAEGSKGNILKIIIIILLIAVLIAGGTAAGYIFATKMKPSQTTTATNQAAVNIKTFSLDEFLVNLKADNTSGYLKTKIYIGYDGDNKDYKNLPTELEDKKPILRDAVNSILRNKKTTDFNEAGVEQIKKEIKDRINPLLKEGQIENVYFYDIIVQAQ
ncbi:flagellar basal body-associated protein FliL [Clostridium homopropionicum DSM 5847]|uniref:Flagellar protein FliL n=1 Tax=Clostridium homopropionicum DSM 5847 TaxID=1121318 RepID=A0A0L6ZDE4_9CLOT|nr:flagellar basal body-associated FliL family protein [Clostridium homopropionicum]KOA21004.1 flagellar basal body-associated protein FliL [Clostridium homopropionicum DSM 5847]SFF99713.1 flagellar FliL protein [Clostridium homopropionicum]